MAITSTSPVLYQMCRVVGYEGGIGVYAKLDIPKGTLILEEEPLLVANYNSLHNIISFCTEDVRKKLFSLHDSSAIDETGAIVFARKTAVGIFHTNGYPTDESKGEGGIFLKVRRVYSFISL